MVHELAHFFVREGHQVTVLSGGYQKQDLRQKGLFHLISFKHDPSASGLGAYLSFMARMMVRFFHVPKHDIVISLSNPPFLGNMSAFFAKAKGMQHIHWCHDIYPEAFHAEGVKLPSRLIRILRKRVRRMMANAACIVVPGRCMARHLTHTGVKTRMIKAIEGWADVDLTDSEILVPDLEDQKGRLLRSHQKATDQLKEDPVPVKFRLLFAGKLEKSKELITLMRAARRLEKKHPEIEFVFTGYGDGLEFLRKEREIRQMSNIKLLPRQPRKNLDSLMQSGDLHLALLKGGATGLKTPAKIYSAFAASRPCIFIGSTKSTAGALINRYKAGDVVSVGEDRRLAQVILEYRNDSDKWFSAQKGAIEAAQQHAPSKAFKAWKELVLKIGKTA